MGSRIAVGIGGWFTFLLVLVAAFHPAVAQQQELVIAIVDFENTSGRAEFDQLERTIPESMLTRFAQAERVRVVERARLEAAIEEMRLGLGGIVDTRTASEIGRAVGATAIIIGSFSIIGDQIRINARLIDVETGEVITGEVVQGGVRGAQIFELTDELSARMLAKLTGERAEPERREPPPISTPPPTPIPTPTPTPRPPRPPARRPGRLAVGVLISRVSSPALLVPVPFSGALGEIRVHPIGLRGRVATDPAGEIALDGTLFLYLGRPRIFQQYLGGGVGVFVDVFGFSFNSFHGVGGAQLNLGRISVFAQAKLWSIIGLGTFLEGEGGVLFSF
ncbi:MAG: FlgO family outer membrane protein [Candidatus Bipolaricaulia bacterium]